MAFATSATGGVGGVWNVTSTPGIYTLNIGACTPENVAEFKKKIKENKMRGLYEIFIVDPEMDEIVFTNVFIAEDATKAERKAAREVPELLDRYVFLSRQIGSNVIPPASSKEAVLVRLEGK